MLLGQMTPRCVHRYVGALGVLQHFFMTLFVTGCLPGLDRTVLQRFVFVRNHEAKINADHAAKSTTGFAGSQRRVKRKRAG